LSKKLFGLVALLFLLPLLLSAPATAAVQRVGIPRLDGINAETEEDPDIGTARFLAGEFDFYPDMIRSSDRDALNASGHQIFVTPGFHVCYIGINMRDNVPSDAGQPNAGASLWPLNNTDFRMALAWAGMSVSQKEAAIADIYGTGVNTPAYSIIPPALGFWHNPTVPKPGGNYTKALEILTAGGFYVSGGQLYGPLNGGFSAVGVGTPLPIEVQSPSSAPTSVEFCQRFVDQWNDFFVNFTGVSNVGFVNLPIDFNTEVVNAFLYRNHEMYWLCWGLSRFPDYLYDFFHSSQDGPWYYNSPGIADATLDGYIETIKWGLDIGAKETAAWDAQVRLYEQTPYIYFYHRLYAEGIRGTDPEALLNAVPLYGTGTDNGWSWDLMHWESALSGGTVNYIWGPFYDNMHPGWGDSAYEVWGLNRISQGLTTVTPDLRDIPWVALDWETETFAWAPLGITQGTKVTFRLRNDLYWNDGFPMTAEDVKFSWEFMVNFPRFYSTYQYLLWVEIHDPQTITAYLDTTSQFIVYDFAGLGFWFPKHIYDPAAHPTRDPVNDPVWEILWTDWMADYTGVMPGTAGHAYYALVNAGTYDFAGGDYSNEYANFTRRTNVGDFFSDSPIEIAVDIPGRVGSMVGGVYVGDDEYYVTIINAGSKDITTGELIACEIESFVVYIDDVVDQAQAVSYSLEPFDSVTFGPYPVTLAPGSHNFTSVAYETGVADPIDVSTQFILGTPREDLNYDFFIGIDDIVRAAEAFGASPPPFPGNERWDSRADMNDDYYCGIDDIVNIAEDFGGP
jgi:ABC-type transport system substrate-binding protein